MNPDNHLPGPGHYSPRDNLTRLNSPAKTISGTDRGLGDIPADQREYPGPGTYNPPSGDQKYSQPSYGIP